MWAFSLYGNEFKSRFYGLDINLNVSEEKHNKRTERESRSADDIRGESAAIRQEIWKYTHTHTAPANGWQTPSREASHTETRAHTHTVPKWRLLTVFVSEFLFNSLLAKDRNISPRANAAAAVRIIRTIATNFIDAALLNKVTNSLSNETVSNRQHWHIISWSKLMKNRRRSW